MSFCPQQLKYWRHQRRLKQEALADAIGMARSTLSRIETGLHIPQPYQVTLLAEALGVDAAALQSQ